MNQEMKDLFLDFNGQAGIRSLQLLWDSHTRAAPQGLGPGASVAASWIESAAARTETRAHIPAMPQDCTHLSDFKQNTNKSN